jgi:hypothetical protein
MPSRLPPVLARSIARWILFDVLSASENEKNWPFIKRKTDRVESKVLSAMTGRITAF